MKVSRQKIKRKIFLVISFACMGIFSLFVQKAYLYHDVNFNVSIRYCGDYDGDGVYGEEHTDIELLPEHGTLKQNNWQTKYTDKKCECGDSFIGTTVLEKDIYCPNSSPVLYPGAHGAILNCNGFSLIRGGVGVLQPASGGSQSQYCPYILDENKRICPYYNDVTIKNCTFNDNAGISVSEAFRWTIQNNIFLGDNAINAYLFTDLKILNNDMIDMGNNLNNVGVINLSTFKGNNNQIIGNRITIASNDPNNNKLRHGINIIAQEGNLLVTDNFISIPEGEYTESGLPQRDSIIRSDFYVSGTVTAYNNAFMGNAMGVYGAQWCPPSPPSPLSDSKNLYVDPDPLTSPSIPNLCVGACVQPTDGIVIYKNTKICSDELDYYFGDPDKEAAITINNESWGYPITVFAGKVSEQYNNGYFSYNVGPGICGQSTCAPGSPSCSTTFSKNVIKVQKTNRVSIVNVSPICRTLPGVKGGSENAILVEESSRLLLRDFVADRMGNNFFFVKTNQTIDELRASKFAYYDQLIESPSNTFVDGQNVGHPVYRFNEDYTQVLAGKCNLPKTDNCLRDVMNTVQQPCEGACGGDQQCIKACKLTKLNECYNDCAQDSDCTQYNTFCTSALNKPGGNVGHITIATSTSIRIDKMVNVGTDPINLIHVSGQEKYFGGTVDYFSDITENRVETGYDNGGIYVYYSDHLNFLKNTSSHNSYGAIFEGMTNSFIGKEGDAASANFFNNNTKAGIYYFGLYPAGSLVQPTNPEKNIFAFNEINDNTFWGLIVTNAYANKFLDNEIKRNGIDGDDALSECSDGKDNDGDGDIDHTSSPLRGGFEADMSCNSLGDTSETIAGGASPQCKDFIDNDLDGKCDFGGCQIVGVWLPPDPDCVSQYDISESFSPGAYLNMAYNNVFERNVFSDNSGDNLYIDSSIIPNKSNKCPLSAGSPSRTAENLFISNNFNGSRHASGVFFDVDSCKGVDPDYLISAGSSTYGEVRLNFFGNFTLKPTNYDGQPFRDNYSNNPGDAANLEPLSGIYPPSSRPFDGLNTMNDNELDGITFSWHAPIPSLASKIRQNDFFKNTISGNKRYGVYSVGSDSAPYILSLNDFVKNTIGGNMQGGIYLNKSTAYRVFGNTISDNREFGVKLEKNTSQYYFSEIGNNGVFVAGNVDYGNIINRIAAGVGHRIGILLSEDDYARVNDNDISGFIDYGIKGYLAKDSEILRNRIHDNIGASPTSTGMALVSSQDWKVGVVDANALNGSEGNTIYSITSPGQYLFVGPDTIYATSTHPYPYIASGNDNVNYTKYYNNIISTENKAGPSGTEKIIYYLQGKSDATYDGDDVTKPDLKNTYHLQLANSSNIVFKNLDMNGADPLEINYYKDTSASGTSGSLLGTSTIQNCRGNCVTFFAVKGFDKFDPFFSNVIVKNPSSDGILMKFVEKTKFSNSTSTLTVASNVTERSAIRMVGSTDNFFEENNFSYTDTTSGFTRRQWEILLAHGSNNNIIKRNIFAELGPNTGPGAYEFRAGSETLEEYVTDKEYYGDDDFCNPSPEVGICDPNCTGDQDNGCAADGSNSCLDFSDLQTGSPYINPRCLVGVDPDYGRYVLGITSPIDDGICIDVNNDGCDPNCTEVGGFHGCNGCTSLGGDCCKPWPDDVCDFDCPRGFDPDCQVKVNTWCENDGSQQNNFINIITAMKKPNYYEPDLQPPADIGGGGVPNGSLFCYVPRAKFSASGSITQRGKYRELGLGERDKNIFRFNINDAWFADLRGQDLKGRIQISTDGSVWQDTVSNFVNGSFKFTYDGLAPNPYHPTVAVVGNYRLGDLAKNPIKTPDIVGLSAYPGSLWTSVYRTGYSFIWDANSMKNSLINFNSGFSESKYARLQVQNKKGGVGSAGDDLNESEIQFNYDFKKPVIASWNLAVTPVQIVTYPKTYKLEWTPVASTDELSWTANIAHYEVWFGEDVAEVKGRANSNTAVAGPFIWDDLVVGSTGPTDPRTKRGVLPYQSCLGPLNPLTDGDCYDSKLGSINCGGSYGSPPGTKCQTTVKVQDPNTVLTYTIQGEYYTSDATIRQCPTDNTPTSPKNGILDNVDNFGSDTTLEADLNDNNCAGSNEVASLIKWNTSAIPSSSCPSVTSATVFVNIPTSPADAASFKMYEILKPWTEDGVTWKTTDGSTPWGTDGAKGASDRGVLLTSIFPGGTGIGYKSVSITAATVQNWISSPSLNNGVIVIDRGINDLLAWHSSEGTEPPKLVITCAAQGTTITNPQFNMCAVDNFGNTECSSVPDIKPWVETRYGNIYSHDSVGTDDDNAPPQGKSSGTFLIQAKTSGGIVKWTADPTIVIPNISKEGKLMTNYDHVATPFPNKSNSFTFSLGSLDFLNKPSVLYLTNVENDLIARYGVYKVVSGINDVPNNVFLGGKIYTHNGDFSIPVNSPKTFKNGLGDQNGSGLFIINGNLTINSNIIYDNSAPPASLKNLASATWIVLGDILIDKSVDKISGAFIALGDPQTTLACPAIDKCGKIKTGNDAGVQKKLEVYGLMMARNFVFERTYTSISEGSEIIILDGRMQMNPPLGIEDFAKNLPVWTK